MVVSVLVVDPHDYVVEWELWLAALPSVTREDPAYHQAGKGCKSKTQSMVSNDYVLLFHHHKVVSPTIVSWEPSVIYSLVRYMI